MNGATVALLLGAIFGSAGIAGLVAVALHYRSENAKTYADSHKTEAEAEATVDDALQRRYNDLFSGLQVEVERLRTNEKDCRDELDKFRRRLGETMQQLGEYRVEAANATADVKMARGEIIRLQDRLDRIEASQ